MVNELTGVHRTMVELKSGADIENYILALEKIVERLRA